MPLLYLSKLTGAERQALEGDIPARVERAIAHTAVAAGFDRRLRPVVGGGRRRGHLAHRLRHRFPDPRARKQICRAAARDGPCARPAAQLCRQRLRRQSRERRGASPMRSMSWRATAGRSRATCAISWTRGSTPSTRRSPAPSLPRRSALIGDRARAAKNLFRRGRRAAKEPSLRPFRAPITARCCATARASDPRRGKPGRSGRDRQGGAGRGRRRPPRRRTPRRRRKAGWCWPRRPWRRRPKARSSPSTARRIKGVYSPALRRFRSGAKAGDHRQSGPGAGARRRSAFPGRPTVRESRRNRMAIRIERGFYRLDGTPVEPNAIKQNDRLVVALKITETEAAYARLILEDRLPAGLEIDNPDLFDGGSAENLQWVKADGRADPYRIQGRPFRRRLRAQRFGQGDFRRRLCRARGEPRANTCCRPRPSRTCIGPNGSDAPVSGRSRFRGARRSETGAPAPWLYAAVADRRFSAWRSRAPG